MLPLYPPKPTGSERGNLQEANLLQKIRIYNGSLRGTKPVARTATGLHEKYLEISQKKPNQCPILSTKKKKRKGKHFMFQKNSKESAPISTFVSSFPLEEQKQS